MPLAPPDLIVFIPECLQLLLTAQVPEVESHTVGVNLPDIEPHRGRDLGQVGPLVVLVEPGLGRLQEGRLARIVQPENKHEEFVLLCEMLVQPGEKCIHLGRRSENTHKKTRYR